MSAELVANCPRCGAEEITFDVPAAKLIRTDYDWQHWYESFAICRKCSRTTIFVLALDANKPYQAVHEQGLLNMKRALNNWVRVEGIINIKDIAASQPPDHVPELVAKIFKEGATAMAVGCHNAAGTMFRLCVDLVTRDKLPPEEPAVIGLHAKTRRDLGLRLPWLFDNGLLPAEMRALSTCIKDDGNDGAHHGTLKKEDADDLLDFTTALLERLYTEPVRLQKAQERRDARRAKPTK